MIINVNNINLYYEVKGNGNPFILLHGNSESSEIFKSLIELLSKNYKVYAIDSRCHGKSSDTKTITYDDMANDILEFINVLKLNKPIIYGFSDGGIIALKIALKTNNLDKIFISGANIKPNGIKLKIYLMMIYGYLKTKDKKYKLMYSNPNIKFKDLKKINNEVIVLAGEYDLIKRKHTIKINKFLNNSSLRIISNEDHQSYVLDNYKLFNIINEFL